MDSSAMGHDYIGKVEKHTSQKDYSDGFGGKFGVQKDRMDKCAVGFQEQSKVGTNYAKTKPDISGAKPSNLKSKFENLSLHTQEDSKARSEEQKRIRQEKDRLDREQSIKEQVSGVGFAGRRN